jgi:hypothetical protein
MKERAMGKVYLDISMSLDGSMTAAATHLRFRVLEPVT